MRKQQLSNGILLHKYGSEVLLKMLIDELKEFKNDFFKLNKIYSLELGIIRFDFIIENDVVKEKLYTIEREVDGATSQTLQKEIFNVYLEEFNKKLLFFLESEIKKVKEELEKSNPDCEYEYFVSNYSTFTYLRNSSILRLEVLL